MHHLLYNIDTFQCFISFISLSHRIIIPRVLIREKMISARFYIESGDLQTT